MQQDFLPLGNLLASVALTTAFTTPVVIDMLNYNPALRNQLQVYLGLTKGAATSFDLLVEYSNDGTKWFQETFETITGGSAAMSLGLYNFTASGNYTVSLPIKSGRVRLSLRANGSPAAGDLGAIDGALGTV